MSLFADRVIFNALAGGTGTFSVGTAVTGFQLPATAAAVSGQTYSYSAQSANLAQWEYGTGTYTSGSPATLTRTVLGNSSAGTSAINFTLPPQVMLTLLGEDVRVKITADINFFVSTGGSNSNDGLSSGTAWLTLQFAIDYIRAHYDLGSFKCFINVAAGTYSGFHVDGPFVGGTLVEVTGAGSASTTVTDASFGSTQTFTTMTLSPVFGINACSLGVFNSNAVGLVNIGYRSQKTSSDMIITGDGGFSIGVQVIGAGVSVAVQASFKGPFPESLIDLDQNSIALAHTCSVDSSVSWTAGCVTNDANSLFINQGFGGTPAASTRKFYAIGGCVMRGTSSTAADLPGDTVGYLQPGSVYTSLTTTQTATPSTGGTVSMAVLRPYLLINTAVLATLTVNLPPKQGGITGENDNLIAVISSNGGITALTVATTDGSSVLNAPTTITAGGSVSMIYHTTTNSWYRYT